MCGYPANAQAQGLAGVVIFVCYTKHTKSAAESKSLEANCYTALFYSTF